MTKKEFLDMTKSGQVHYLNTIAKMLGVGVLAYYRGNKLIDKDSNTVIDDVYGYALALNFKKTFSYRPNVFYHQIFEG